MAGMDDTTHLHGRFELRHTTTLSGRVHFSSEGRPLAGVVTLTAPGGRSWTGAVSVSAVDAAEARWTRMREGEHTADDAALLLTRLAVAYDADFFGLDVDWDNGELELAVTGEVVRFSVPARWAELLDAGVQRATVRIELTGDRQVTFAEFVLTDGDELVVLEQEDLDVSAHAGPGLDALAASSRQALTRCLVERGMPAPSYWRLAYAEAPALDEQGAYGELRVWTLVKSVATV
jgi:hypothetical protein